MVSEEYKRKVESTRRTHTNGSEYWLAREIQADLGYETWENFETAIGRAVDACRSAGYKPSNHFRATTKMVRIGSGAERKTRDYFLSRYACYLIAMNADSSKPEVGNAQTYFAYKTRKQELNEEFIAMVARVEKRQVAGLHLKQLNGIAKKSGVKHFGVFQDRGNFGLYGMTTRAIKAKKHIPEKETILDYAGIAELSAHDFRSTQTAAVLAKLNIHSEHQANAIHERVGKNVREAIEKSGNILPEDLPAEPHIKLIEREIKAAQELPPKGGEAV
jgi:DNA-damage-inducible protein D